MGRNEVQKSEDKQIDDDVQEVRKINDRKYEGYWIEEDSKVTALLYGEKWSLCQTDENPDILKGSSLSAVFGLSGKNTVPLFPFLSLISVSFAYTVQSPD